MINDKYTQIKERIKDYEKQLVKIYVPITYLHLVEIFCVTLDFFLVVTEENPLQTNGLDFFTN